MIHCRRPATYRYVVLGTVECRGARGAPPAADRPNLTSNDRGQSDATRVTIRHNDDAATYAATRWPTGQCAGSIGSARQYTLAAFIGLAGGDGQTGPCAVLTPELTA